jgi:hypothetical protein
VAGKFREEELWMHQAENPETENTSEHKLGTFDEAACLPMHSQEMLELRFTPRDHGITAWDTISRAFTSVNKFDSARKASSLRNIILSSERDKQINAHTERLR